MECGRRMGKPRRHAARHARLAEEADRSKASFGPTSHAMASQTQSVPATLDPTTSMLRQRKSGRALQKFCPSVYFRSSSLSCLDPHSCIGQGSWFPQPPSRPPLDPAGTTLDPAFASVLQAVCNAVLSILKCSTTPGAGPVLRAPDQLVRAPFGWFHSRLALYLVHHAGRDVSVP